MTTGTDSSPRRVGRPRSTTVDDAIRTAALEEFARHGYDAMRIESVAERAGVAKSTLYRRFPNKEDLVRHTLASTSDEVTCPHTDSLSEDLVAMLAQLRDRFATELMGRAVPALVAAAARHDELRRIHRRFLGERRRSGMERLRCAVEHGELPAGVDADLIMDQLGGTLFYRSFVSGGDLSDAALSDLVERVLTGHREPLRSDRRDRWGPTVP